MEPGASAERWHVFILLKCWESLPGVIRSYWYTQYWESSLNSENPRAQLHSEFFLSA